MRVTVFSLPFSAYLHKTKKRVRTEICCSLWGKRKNNHATENSKKKDKKKEKKGRKEEKCPFNSV